MPANQSTPEVTRAEEARRLIEKLAGADIDVSGTAAIGITSADIIAANDWLSATPARGGDELREALEEIAGLPHGLDISYAGDIARAALASTDMTGAGEVLEACPVCHGDCGSANPPVIFCPMRDVGQEKPTECSVCSGSGEMPLLRNDGIFDYVPCPSCATPPAMPSPVEGLTSEEGWPAYGHWLPDAWDAYLRDLVGWEYMSGWAKLPATFRWSDFYDCLREHAPAISPKATATASVREGLAIPTDIPQYDEGDISHLEGLASYLDSEAKRKGREKLPASRDLFNTMAKRLRQFDTLLSSLTDSGTAATIGGERA